MTGCSPNEPTIKSIDQNQEYADNWKNIIGDIDPEQSWNIATQCSLTVNTGTNATVSIYTKSTRGSYLVAQTEVSGSKTIKFDVPKTIDEVYVVKTAQGDREVQTVNINTASQVNFGGRTAFRQSTRSSMPLMPREKVYAVDYNLFAGMYSNSFGDDYINKIGYTHYHDLYKSWESEIYAIQEWQTYDNFTVGEEYTLQGSKYQDVAETCANMYVADDDNITKLYPYTQNYKITTTEAGEISLIGIYRNTNANSALVYFYTDKGATLEEQKKADKYVLIPSNANVVNRKFTLVYYDPDNNFAPTTTFPAGKEIHFGLVRGYNAEGSGALDKSVDWTQETGDIYVPTMYASLCLFSNAELNKDVTAVKGWTNISGSALYSTHGVNILSFEDWGGKFSIVDGQPVPEGTNSIDWNDIAFIIDGKVEELPTIDETQSWILACEDLGNTDDFDFNDIVFSITYAAGSETATITPLAAGGELASTVFFNNERIGEIHDMLVPGSPSNVMLNTVTKGNAGKPVTINVGTDFSMAATDMGGFNIVVEGNSSQATIAAPEAGSTPQMICVDGTNWLWPTERTSITTAYDKFSIWATDHTQALDWYVTPSDNNAIVK